MDLNSIGIGAIVGAAIVVVTNIFLHQKNRQYDLSKEQLTNLYNPLNAHIKKKHKHLSFLRLNKKDFNTYVIEYYKFYLELQEIYFANEVYASLNLRNALHTLQHNHELEYHNYSRKYNSDEEILEQVALFEIQHSKNSNGKSEFERKLERFIQVVHEDLHQIYHRKR